MRFIPVVSPELWRHTGRRHRCGCRSAPGDVAGAAAPSADGDPDSLADSPRRSGAWRPVVGQGARTRRGGRGVRYRCRLEHTSSGTVKTWLRATNSQTRPAAGVRTEKIPANRSYHPTTRHQGDGACLHRYICSGWFGASAPLTTNGRLAERYNIKRTWAKDLWHLCDRIIRKILSHTAAVVLTTRAGHQPLQFDAWAA